MRGHLAGVHGAARRQVRVLGVMHDQRAEVLGVEQRVAHDARVADARLAVGEGDRAGALQQSDLGQLRAFQALGHSGHGVHVDDRVVAGAALDEVDKRDLVDHGIGVGHDDDGGDAAGSGGVARRLQGLAVLVAGLAGEDLRVDKAGRQDVALAVDDLAAVGGVAAQVARRGRRSCRPRTSRPPGSSRPEAGSISRALMNTVGFKVRPALGAGMALVLRRRSAGGARAPRAPPCGRRRPSRPARG